MNWQVIIDVFLLVCYVVLAIFWFGFFILIVRYYFYKALVKMKKGRGDDVSGSKDTEN